MYRKSIICIILTSEFKYLEKRLCGFRFSEQEFSNMKWGERKTNCWEQFPGSSVPSCPHFCPPSLGTLALTVFSMESHFLSVPIAGAGQAGHQLGEHKEQESRWSSYEWLWGSFQGLSGWHLSSPWPCCGHNRNAMAFQMETLGGAEVR